MLRLEGHEGAYGGAVNSLAFSPDGRTALSSGADGQAYLWDLQLKTGGGKGP